MILLVLNILLSSSWTSFSSILSDTAKIQLESSIGIKRQTSSKEEEKVLKMANDIWRNIVKYQVFING